jgi:hypothetical protein
MIVSLNALSCPDCGRLLVEPERVVEGTVVAASSHPSPISVEEAAAEAIPDARPNRLARLRTRSTALGALARFVQDAWNEPVVRVAASAALIAIGERLADRLAGADRGRRASRREHAAPSQYKRQDATQSMRQGASEDRSVIPYTYPGELADRGYVGGMIETLIIIRRTIRRR